MSAYADFWALVNVRSMRECWEWLGSFDSYGYGFPPAHIQIAFGEPLAHRVACRILHGEGEGRHVLHACDNSRCCNPRHLRWGSTDDNARDKQVAAWTRNAESARLSGNDVPAPWDFVPPDTRITRRGEPRLTASIVREMRSAFLSGESVRSIAARFQTTHSHTDSVVKRRIWKHVPDQEALKTH